MCEIVSLDKSCNGYFKLTHFKNGVLVDQYKNNNLVVNNAREIMSGLLIDEPEYNVDTLRIGNSSVVPSKSNVGLLSPAHSVSFETKTLDTSAATHFASFRFIIEIGDMPSGAYSEFGLFSAEKNMMFSRIVMLPNGFFYDQNSSAFEIVWGVKFLP